MEIYVAILTVCAVVITLFLVLASIRIWVTCRVLEEFILTLHRETTPILQDLQETSHHLKKISRSLREKAQETEHQIEDTLNRLLGVVDDFVSSLRNWRQKLLSFKTGSSLLLPVGLKLFKKFFSSKQDDYHEEEVEDNG